MLDDLDRNLCDKVKVMIKLFPLLAQFLEKKHKLYTQSLIIIWVSPLKLAYIITFDNSCFVTFTFKLTPKLHLFTVTSRFLKAISDKDLTLITQLQVEDTLEMTHLLWGLCLC